MPYDMTKSEREAFLSDVHVGVLSITCKGRGPITVPVWYSYEPGGEIIFCTDKSSRKATLLEVEGRCTLCVQDENPPYSYVSVEGLVVSMEECDHDRDVGHLARRYLGVEAGNRYVEETRGEVEQILVRVRPERWSSADYGKES